MKIILFAILFAFAQADVLSQAKNKGATLKPISACCVIPELGDPKPLMECSNPKLAGPPYLFPSIVFPEICTAQYDDERKISSRRTFCNDVQCVFEKSGFLVDKNTLNKEAYKTHLRQWAENHEGWSEAVEKAIKDCVDQNLRQYLDDPCKAYDVFTCTGIAMLKKCPESAWTC